MTAGESTGRSASGRALRLSGGA